MSGFAAGLLGGVSDAYDDKLKKERQAKQDRQFEMMMGGGKDPAPTHVSGPEIQPNGAPMGIRPRGNPGAAGDLMGYVDATEGGGDYSTLFGHSQRDGGRFAGTDVTKMTIGQLYEFTDPNGAYGQWVKEANPKKEVATPLGRYQIVGSTLRDTAKTLGLSDDTVFSPSVQDQMFNHLANRRLASATDIGGKVAALRNEWRGFRNVPDDEIAAAIVKYEQGGGVIPSRPLGVRGPA